MATTENGITTLTVSGVQVEDAVAKKHEHSNSSTLDKLSENDGKLLFDGAAISGGSGDGGATATWTTNTTVGNLASSTNLTGLTALEILQKMTVSYVKPKATVTYSVTDSIIETGTTISTVVTVSGLTKGTSDISKIQLYNGSTLVQTLTYSSSTTIYSFTAVSISATSTLKIRVVDTDSQYTEYSKTYTFTNATYYGTTSDVPTDATGLTKVLRTKSTFENKFTCDNKHVVFLSPVSFGNLKSILDGNGFENITDFTKTTITIGSVSYNAYYTTGKKTLNSFTYKFIY